MRLFLRHAQKLGSLKGEYTMKLLRALRAKITGPTAPAPTAPEVSAGAPSDAVPVFPSDETDKKT